MLRGATLCRELKHQSLQKNLQKDRQKREYAIAYWAMKRKRLDLKNIPDNEITPWMKLVIEEILYLRDENQRLKDEIALLKKGRPQR